MIDAPRDDRPLEQRDGTAPSFLFEYGRLAFRSPEILGGNARRAGLSCQSCHTNGHINKHFFIPGLSDAPGRVDVTHYLWNIYADDGISNPRDIPSLRDVKTRSRLGFDQRGASLREFTRAVIAVEFAGAEPDAMLLDALTAYMNTLQTPPAGIADRDPAAGEEDGVSDLRRYLRALAMPLAAEDGPLAARLAQMIRASLGRRYDHSESSEKNYRARLTDWSARLAEIRTAAEAKEFPLARMRLQSLMDALSMP